MRFGRLIQGVSLLLFLGLLVLATGTIAERVRLDLFLRMDPLVFFASLAGGRASLRLLLPGLVVVLLTPLLGRFFCSALCPLGTTIDLSDRLLGKARKRWKQRITGQPGTGARAWKYLLLAFAAGAVLAGSSLFLLVSPLSLATRFYGLVLIPVLASVLGLGAWLARGAGNLLGIGALEYLSVPAPGYAHAWATLTLTGLVLGMGVFAPRFWCRFLCPSGAVLSLLSSGRLLKRDVSERCTGCGVCGQACPMGAAGRDPEDADGAQCIVCGKCRDICPADAVSFRLRRSGRGLGRTGPADGGETPGPGGQEPGGAWGFSKNRRTLLLSGITGAGGAVLALLLPGGAGARAATPGDVRPPGALPESHFLARCVRCGECMRACPTNTLQPAPLASGVAEFFSPVLTPRIGPCEPTCTRCGQVCPTGALRALPHGEKIWAKIGTASIIRRRCLAWERGRECLVCDEVCPFGAVELRRTRESPVAVPFVDGNLCNGCGYCEHHCPVGGPSAIVVTPEGALRLEQGSYVKAARGAGMRFEVQQPSTESGDGFPGEGTGGLPPGFDR
jgi:MauM/NapG family ferredoxin protein